MAIVSILWAVFFWLISTAVWAQDRSIPVPILQQIKKFSDEIKLHSDHLVNTHRYYEAQIEGLIKTHPDHEQAKAMRQILLDKKQERKRILLAAWDHAIQNQETDRSLEILKELDQYLTPNEGLALQEAARDVFRTKLHN